MGGLGEDTCQSLGKTLLRNNDSEQLFITPSFQVSYHELETYNGDSRSMTVHDPYFALSNLMPGRNYSISIQAVSNGIESAERSIFQATSKLVMLLLGMLLLLLLLCCCCCCVVVEVVVEKSPSSKPQVNSQTSVYHDRFKTNRNCQ